jgi:aminopeptidase YwaD
MSPSIFRRPFPAALLVPIALVVAVALTLDRPADSTARSDPSVRAERTLAATVSETRMVETVRRLVGFGTRMYGTPSNHASAAWLAQSFREAGLEVTVREDVPRAWYLPRAWDVTVRRGATGRAGTKLETTWPRSGSPSAEGEGTLSSTPAPGVVWLTSENPNAEAAAGCRAVLTDNRPSSSGWPGIGRLRGNWTIPVFGIGTEEAAALRTRLEAGETVRISFTLQADTGEGAGQSVVATLPGRDRSKYILFCGHGDSDSGGPGADDNASGASIVLEVARVVAAAVREGLLPTLPWDLRFAVWGGEISSTRQYLAAMAEDPSALQAVFNYDQSGYGTWKDALYVEPDDVPANTPLITLVRQVMSDHLGTPGFPEHAASVKSQGGTDSYVFQPTRDPEATIYPSVTLYTSAWDRERPQPVTEGFPPLNWYADEEPGMVTVDGDAFYHSAGDTPANTTDTEPWNMGWCARVGLLSAVRLMGG